MSYVSLIPSIMEYADRFRQLDSLDFKIVKVLSQGDVTNVSKLARLLNIPQQTLSHRVKRLDEKDIVRFRALIDEARLGLKNLLVIAPCRFGGEKVSSHAMTCFPLWRYLATVDGGVHGNYVRYLIPSDRENDFVIFLDELVKRGIILSYEVFPTASPNYPLLNLDFFQIGRGTPVFNWDKWVEDLDSFPEESLTEPVGYSRADFDLYDLTILRCLEINARMKLGDIAKEMAKILMMKEHTKLVSLVSRRLKRKIIPQKMIRGYRPYVFPNMGQNTMFLIYHLSFGSTSAMRRFAGGLKHLPYNANYQKALQKDELFLHLAIPAYEYTRMNEAMKKLGETERVKAMHAFLGDLANATWDNVEIHQMYKDNAWDFSYGTVVRMLEKVLSAKR